MVYNFSGTNSALSFKTGCFQKKNIHVLLCIITQINMSGNVKFSTETTEAQGRGSRTVEDSEKVSTHVDSLVCMHLCRRFNFFLDCFIQGESTCYYCDSDACDSAFCVPWPGKEGVGRKVLTGTLIFWRERDGCCYMVSFMHTMLLLISEACISLDSSQRE